MSIRDGIIYPPVSMTDVRMSIGRSDETLEALCSRDTINRWARYKPVPYAAKGRLTESILSSVNYGLQPSSMLNTPKCLYHNFVQQGYSYTWDSVINEWVEWPYQRPSGGDNSPYRLSDFAATTDGQAWGYNHITPPPMVGYGQFGITLSRVRAIANDETITTIDGTGGSQYNRIVSKFEGAYTNFNARFGQEEWQKMRYASIYTIPLTTLFAEAFASDANFRVGLLVYLPHAHHTHLMVGAATFREGFTNYRPNFPQIICPTLCSNQYLCKEIGDYFRTNRLVMSEAFEALPVLVKNAYVGGLERPSPSTVPYVFSTADTNTVIYSAPSRRETVTIVVNRDEELTIYDYYEMTTESNGYYASMGNGASWGQVAINMVKIRYYGDSMATATTIYYKAEIRHITGMKGSAPIFTFSTRQGSVTFPAGSVEGDSVDIEAFPGATAMSYELSYTAL